MPRLFFALLAGLALGSASRLTAGDVERKYDLEYAVVDGESLKLDLAVPKGPGPHPVVVCLHGGAWKLGSRKDLSSPKYGLDFGVMGASLIEALAAKGYAAASVSYRLAPKNKFPAQIADAKTAVRFLRANAGRFDLDPDRVAALGFSAGGHLAALLGTTDSAAGFDGDPYPGVSSAVGCVVDFFGPADLSLYGETPGVEQVYMVPFLGGKVGQLADSYRKASPLGYVTKATCPFLIVHGTADVVVPILHSERLSAKLTENGVKAEFVRVKGKGHGWGGEAAAETTAAAVKFLNENLKGK